MGGQLEGSGSRRRALTIAIAVPESFGDRALLLALAYVVMALFRVGYMALLFRSSQMCRNYVQLGFWSAVSGLFWIAGAFVEPLRPPLWILAVLIDYLAPYSGFWMLGRGTTPIESWPLRGLHLFERNQLILIIALGESILFLGAMMVENDLHLDVIIAGAIGFSLIVSIWWIYFVDLSEPCEDRFAQAEDHTRLARAGMAYAHSIMVCGAIVIAVSIEMIVAHARDAIHEDIAIVAFAGPAIFLIGASIFHRTMLETLRWPYLLAIAALGGWCWWALSQHLTGLMLGGGVLGVIVALPLSGSLQRRS
ncbi:MAG: low temperature requirement protein A [Pseudomonadota bacterium]